MVKRKKKQTPEEILREDIDRLKDKINCPAAHDPYYGNEGHPYFENRADEALEIIQRLLNLLEEKENKIESLYQDIADAESFGDG